MRRRRRDRSRGQGLVEFALIFPVLILILVSIFDVGRLVFAYNTMGNAAREGVRLAIVNQNTPMIQQRVLNYSPTINAANPPTTIAVTSTACPTEAEMNVGCDVTVQIDTTFPLITPIVSNIIGPVHIHVTSTEPLEFKCGTATAPITDPTLCPKQPNN